jgi:hypothetical protein
VQYEYQTLPVAAALPHPRAKRIVVHIPNAQAANKTLTVTTDTGTVHAIVLSKVGNAYQSDPLFFEVGSTGARALGGFPVQYDTTGGNEGVSGDGDPPVTVVEDLGGEAVLRFTDPSGGSLQDVVIRRLPNGTTESGVHIITEGTQIAGAKLRLISGPPIKDLRERHDQSKYFITVDEDTWNYLNEAAAAALEHAEFVDAALALEAEEAAAARALDQKYGVTQTGWHFRGPRSLQDWKDFSKGFAVGTGQQLNETLNPWEIVKGLGQLAAFVHDTNFADFQAAEAFKRILVGHIEDMGKAFDQHRYNDAGISAGNAFIFYLSIPVSAALAPAVVAKFSTICKAVRVKFVILPKTSSVFVGSLLGGAQAILERIALRVRYAKYSAATGRIEGKAVANVDRELVAARVGSKAQGFDFAGVDPARFTPPLGDLERGHLIAKQLGGRGIRDNLVPLYKRVNQKLHKDLEAQVAQWAKDGKNVEYTVEPVYGVHPSIPEKLIVKAVIDGVEVLSDTLLNVP